MLALSCDKGGVIFPVKEGDIKESNFNFGIEVYDGLSKYFYRFPYVIPATRGLKYATFKSKIEAQENELRSRIKSAMGK